eukprot:753198-Hanusia_phi.AAC.1
MAQQRMQALWLPELQRCRAADHSNRGIMCYRIHVSSSLPAMSPSLRALDATAMMPLLKVPSSPHRSNLGQVRLLLRGHCQYYRAQAGGDHLGPLSQERG